MSLRFLGVKAFRTALTLWLVVTFVFVVLRTSGDPLVSLLPADSEPEVIEHYRTLWGLDRPLPVQYLRYMAAVFQGDFGISLRDTRPVIDLVTERVPATALLGFVALALALAVGVPLGILAAVRRNTLLDRLTMAFAVLGFAIPNFFFGILMILTFSLTLRWLPSSGTGTAWHLIMPACTLGLATAGALARFTRSSMLEVLRRPYMRTAQAKGVAPGGRILRHALPNAAIPVVTVVGFSLGGLIGGAIVTETVFAWPGVGRLLVSAVAARDLAVVQGLVLLIAATMVIANLVVDLLYGLLDPRIRVASVDA